MPKNKGKGGKRFRRGKRQSGYTTLTNVPMAGVNADTLYGWIEKALGNCRFQVRCTDGVERLAHVPGKFKKRVWANVGCLVLLQVRPTSDAKADIMYVYNNDEVRKLRQWGEIPSADTNADAEADIVVFDADLPSFTDSPLNSPPDSPHDTPISPESI